mmetsp:Transcript_11510/g.29474  ORF Transcript_11510/g.29474 Transcript_11510/m.29474 type:complete len:158 (+) Transcript_11510:159-632(+)
MADSDFNPAPGFAGARQGWVFKMGGRGLGYYRDGAQGEPSPAAAAACKPAGVKPQIGGFANDGSFMEQFRRMQQEKRDKEAADKAQATATRAAAKEAAQAKRKAESGAKGEPTASSVKKRKSDKADDSGSAWQAYLDEVKMYESQTCKEYQQGAIVK